MMEIVFGFFVGVVLAGVSMLYWSGARNAVRLERQLRMLSVQVAKGSEAQVDRLDWAREELLSMRALSGGYEVHTKCPGIFFQWFSVQRGWTGAVAMSHTGPSATVSCSAKDLSRMVQSAEGLVASEWTKDLGPSLKRSAKRFLDAVVVTGPEPDGYGVESDEV